MTRSEVELWEQRASAAADAAAQLGQLGRDLRRVLSRYYMGDGCVEGESLHRALLDLTRTEADKLLSLADAAEELAVNCARTAEQLADTDEVASGDISAGKP